jgi:hypothetical protein
MYYTVGYPSRATQHVSSSTRALQREQRVRQRDERTIGIALDLLVCDPPVPPRTLVCLLDGIGVGLPLVVGHHGLL